MKAQKPMSGRHPCPRSQFLPEVDIKSGVQMEKEIGVSRCDPWMTQREPTRPKKPLGARGEQAIALHSMTPSMQAAFIRETEQYLPRAAKTL